MNSRRVSLFFIAAAAILTSSAVESAEEVQEIRTIAQLAEPVSFIYALLDRHEITISQTPTLSPFVARANEEMARSERDRQVFSGIVLSKYTWWQEGSKIKASYRKTNSQSEEEMFSGAVLYDGGRIYDYSEKEDLVKTRMGDGLPVDAPEYLLALRWGASEKSLSLLKIWKNPGLIGENEVRLTDKDGRIVFTVKHQGEWQSEIHFERLGSYVVPTYRPVLLADGRKAAEVHVKWKLDGDSPPLPVYVDHTEYLEPGNEESWYTDRYSFDQFEFKPERIPSFSVEKLKPGTIVNDCFSGESFTVE